MNTASKIAFWNIWGHRYGGDVHTFLKQHADVDIFCLTEVTDVKQSEIDKRGHNLVFTGDEAASQVDGYAQLVREFGETHTIFYTTADYREWKCEKTGVRFKDVGFGSALVVQAGVNIIDAGNIIIDFKEVDFKSRAVQWIVYEKGGVRYLVLHLHGLWIRGNTKGDHDARYHQSDFVREIIANLCKEHRIEKVIFGGDFNLDLNTYALYLMQNGRDGMDEVKFRNLIVENHITNTRTRQYRNYEVDGSSQYADYILVSGAVEVHSFAVDNNTMASDHAPLIVSFS